MKLETLVILVLGGVLLRVWWQSNRRRLSRFLHRWKTHLPRRWHPKTPEACPHCQASVSVQRIPREVTPYRAVKSRRGKPKQVKTAGYACPNPACAYFGIQDEAVHALVGYGKDGRQHIQRFRCQACQTTFSCRRGTALYRLKTAESKVEMVLWFLSEGVDLAVLVRYSGHAEATLLRWLERAGQHSETWHRLFMVGLVVAVVQLDEIYTRIRGVGKRWLWLAIDPLSKVILAVHLGHRRGVDAQAVVHEVKHRLQPGAVLPAFLTDGLRAYFDALTAHFGHWVPGARKAHWEPDEQLVYGQLVKRRERRHVVQTIRRVVIGQPRALIQRLVACGLSGRIQTAFIERVNLTLRRGVSLLARRTWSLAQSETHLLRHVQWWQAYYHLVRTHQALALPLPGLAQRCRQRTPAMAMGLTDHVWTVGEFLRTPLYAA
jgi:transposase-like protein/IS1 family transposase